MFHQELRTHAAEELRNLLTSPHAQEHLRRYGWQPAMPIVITAPYETLDTAMGLVSTYNSAVLIGCYDPYSDELTLWHVSGPDSTEHLEDGVELKRNEAYTFREMCQKAMQSPAVRFRPKGWNHDVRVREIPLFARSDRLTCSRVQMIHSSRKHTRPLEHIPLGASGT